VRARMLASPHEPAALAREVRQMRERMHAAHPNGTGLFDVKHDPGGMIDVEFAVQFLVLAHAHRWRNLAENLGNIALLGIAARHGLLGPALAERAQAAYREYRRLQHGLRLNGAAYARVPPAQIEDHARAVRALWTAVLG
ncbi:MAG: bifunctional [glutamate--ammonia ligase]-adenylyl-L-tyrosine phosphorylase/[glutamate--ammonia-ligase] adenylyltransferase, partial [Burkholderiales bacterium]